MPPAQPLVSSNADGIMMTGVLIGILGKGRNVASYIQGVHRRCMGNGEEKKTTGAGGGGSIVWCFKSFGAKLSLSLSLPVSFFPFHCGQVLSPVTLAPFLEIDLPS